MKLAFVIHLNLYDNAVYRYYSQDEITPLEYAERLLNGHYGEIRIPEWADNIAKCAAMLRHYEGDL